MNQKASDLRGDNESPSPEEVFAMPEPAPETAAADSAEALLACGDIRGAADAYRAAGRYDEAIHLYVNVLGLPGEAAPLVAEMGNHEARRGALRAGGRDRRGGGQLVSIAEQSEHPRRSWSASSGCRRTRRTTSSSTRPTSARSRSRPSSCTTSTACRSRAGGERGAGHSGLRDHPDRGRGVPGRRRTAERLAIGSGGRAAGGTADPDGPHPGEDRAGHLLERAPGRRGRGRGDGSCEHRPAARRAPDDGGPQPRDPRNRALSTPGSRSRSVRSRWTRPRCPSCSSTPPFSAARTGPSVSQLQKFVEGQTCELGNIEVFYRLGLAHLASGDWAEALAAFRAVEEASPGYRDALLRSEEVEAWQSKLAPKLTSLGVAGTVIRKKNLNRYTLHGELGRGGMAVVYRGRDEVLGRDVALKFLSENMTAHAEGRGPVPTRGSLRRTAHHPNVITIYDFGTLEGRAFIAMEYVEGMTVKDMLDSRGRLSVMESLHIITQLLDALEYAHACSIIHRDIKASNVMVTSMGLVKLMDFGLAKSQEGQEQASMNRRDRRRTCRREQMDPVASWTRAPTLFAVGVTLYEMLAGKLPFKHLDRSPPER